MLHRNYGVPVTLSETREQALARIKIEEQEREAEQLRRKIAWDIWERPFTDEEMQFVRERGEQIFVPAGVGYYPRDISKLLQDALLQQAKLKAIERIAASFNLRAFDQINGI